LIKTQRYSPLALEQLQNAVKLLDGVIGEKRGLTNQEPQVRIKFPLSHTDCTQ
jgi:hypothetical protein